MDTDKIVQRILRSKKYRSIYPPTVRRIVNETVRKYPEKQVEKQSRKKLHQLVTTYFIRPNYAKLTQEVSESIHRGENTEAICRNLLRLQTSTKERLPYYSEYYYRIFEITGTPRSIADYGCGANPFSYPWIGNNTTYTGYDLDGELNQFINETMILLHLNNWVTVQDHDVLINKSEKSDLALYLKIIPLLGSSTLPILRQTPAPYIVVSFPTRTIGGRDVGMLQHHTEQFTSLIKDESWNVHEIEYDNEIVFVIKKS